MNNQAFFEVEDLEEVLANIKQFNLEIGQLIHKLSLFRQWYYDRSLDQFGPSKFIGYKDMNSSKYESTAEHYDIDGRDTEAILKGFIVSTTEDEIHYLKIKLYALLSVYGKKPNNKFQIHMLYSESKESPFDIILKQFKNDMMQIYVKAKKECNYTASRYFQMLTNKGAMHTALSLIYKHGGTEGFEKLWEKGRLDLTIEALVYEKYMNLFAEEEREICRSRLADFGYKFPRVT